MAFSGPYYTTIIFSLPASLDERNTSLRVYNEENESAPVAVLPSNFMTVSWDHAVTLLGDVFQRFNTRRRLTGYRVVYDMVQVIVHVDDDNIVYKQFVFVCDDRRILNQYSLEEMEAEGYPEVSAILDIITVLLFAAAPPDRLIAVGNAVGVYGLREWLISALNRHLRSLSL